MMRSILEPFYEWAGRNPDQLLYAFLDIDGRTTESYTYAQFLQRTSDIAVHIRQTRSLKPGDRVLLAYPPGVEPPPLCHTGRTSAIRTSSPRRRTRQQ